ncbi:ATP-binding protein [Azotobacter salinestris]|uniref:ATP-binding protein n=1 Tax=Azotobacter salinestris TaxID=69964 RepID=UPI0032DF0381
MPRAMRYSLRQWIWRVFMQCALIPLFLVELVLIGAYLLSNAAMRDAQLAHLEERAQQGLAGTVRREAEIIGWDLQSIEKQTRIFRGAVAHALQERSFRPDAVERARHVVGPDGLFYSRSGDGRAVSFYVKDTPPERQDHAKALRLSHLDFLMRSIEEAGPLVVAVHFRSWDGYIRSYPFFDVLQRDLAGRPSPAYGFYSRADQAHNPGREPVWTDPYPDANGRWRMSTLAPVYHGDFLEGVVGLEIDLERLLADIGELGVPWQGHAVLIDAGGNVMLLPGQHRSPGDSIVNAPRYLREVKHLLPAVGAEGEVQAAVFDGREHLLAWQGISQTGWRLLLVADKDRILQPTRALAAHHQKMGYLLIAGLLLFHVLLLVLWWRHSRRLSRELERPIGSIVDMLRHLGQSEWQPGAVQLSPLRASRIEELNAMADAVRSSDRQLQASEAERSRAQRLLEVVMENTTESLWEIVAEKSLIRVSSRFARRFALDSECVTIEEFNRLVHPDDMERLRQRRESFFSGADGVYEVEYRCIDRVGQYVWLLSRGQALEWDANGRVLHSAGTHVDISRLKAVEEDLRRATLEAQDASRAKSRFLSSMSHELRTPLNAVQGFAQLIELEVEGKSETEPVGEYAREIVKASRHLTALVDDILDLSTLEGRRQHLQIRPVEVGAMLASCVELVQPQARDFRLQLTLVSGRLPLYVQADSRRLRQILLNLLSNAIKYNRPQGTVTLGHEVRPDCVRLWVKDTGPGLDADQQKQLFQPFQRLGRESSNIPGSGIGLVLCYELAGMMNGSLGFHSEPGQGCCFWIDLPGAASPEEEQAAFGNGPSAGQVEWVEDDS